MKYLRPGTATEEEQMMGALIFGPHGCTPVLGFYALDGSESWWLCLWTWREPMSPMVLFALSSHFVQL